MTRSSRNSSHESTNNNQDTTTNNNNPEQQRSLTEAGRRRMQISRAVAEREASRLARPERRGPTGFLPHASRSKSAVTSTPTGVVISPQGKAAAEVEQWCGPFSVARQMIAAREEAKAQREAELQRRKEEGEEGEDSEAHPLDALVAGVDLERRRRLHPSLRWKSNIVPEDDNDDENDDDGNDKDSPKKRKKRKDNLYVKRRKRMERQRKQSFTSTDNPAGGVPSLFRLCLNLLVQHFEHVEGLGDMVDSSIRRKLCEELVARNKLDGDAFLAIAEVGIEALEMIDCAKVTQEQLSATLRQLLPAGLTVLLLGNAGRCFGPKTVESIVQATPSISTPAATGSKDDEFPIPTPTFATTTSTTATSLNPAPSFPTTTPGLQALAVGGAYLLKDADAATLIRSTSPSLRSLEFTACPLLQSELCHAVAQAYSSLPSSSGITGAPLLELSLGDMPQLTKNHFWQLASTDALRHVKSLKLQSLDAVDDDVVHALLSAAMTSNDKEQDKSTNNNDNYNSDPTKWRGPLEHITLSYNLHLTDRTLSYLRHCPSLCSLHLAGLKNITSAGLEALFVSHMEGVDIVGSPPRLKRLDVSECAEGTVTDEVVKFVVLASNPIAGGGGGVGGGGSSSSSSVGGTAATAGGAGGLVYLNLNGAATLTDTAMEALVEHCPLSLVELDVSFCPRITDKGLGYLVSKMGMQLQKMHVWGCAQITEEFLDGHDRVAGGSGSGSGVGGGLEVVGAWMKKSGGRSWR